MNALLSHSKTFEINKNSNFDNNNKESAVGNRNSAYRLFYMNICMQIDIRTDLNARPKCEIENNYLYWDLLSGRVFWWMPPDNSLVSYSRWSLSYILEGHLLENREATGSPEVVITKLLNKLEDNMERWPFYFTLLWSSFITFRLWGRDTAKVVLTVLFC